MTSLSVRGAHAFSLLALLTWTAIFLTTGSQTSTHRVVDASNLRQIGMGALIYADNHEARLPEAKNIWGYAQILAESAGLENARIWQSSIDPASASTHAEKIDILLASKPGEPKQVNPTFLKIKPAFAVALGKLDTSMPSTTPIAWTRGLQPDGTWAVHSPYGHEGGFIVFLSGNVKFFRDMTEAGGQLTRFDGEGPTANILEALPAGTRIGEYTPTSDEQTAWASTLRRKLLLRSFLQPWIVPLLIVWLPYLAVSIYRLKNRRPGAFTVLIWPALLTFFLLLVIPTV